MPPRAATAKLPATGYQRLNRRRSLFFCFDDEACCCCADDELAADDKCRHRTTATGHSPSARGLASFWCRKLSTPSTDAPRNAVRDVALVAARRRTAVLAALHRIIAFTAEVKFLLFSEARKIRTAPFRLLVARALPCVIQYVASLRFACCCCYVRTY